MAPARRGPLGTSSSLARRRRSSKAHLGRQEGRLKVLEERARPLLLAVQQHSVAAGSGGGRYSCHLLFEYIFRRQQQIILCWAVRAVASGQSGRLGAGSWRYTHNSLEANTRQPGSLSEPLCCKVLSLLRARQGGAGGGGPLTSCWRGRGWRCRRGRARRRARWAGSSGASPRSPRSWCSCASG